MTLNIAILCGGQNVEHDVSLMSVANVISDLNPEQFRQKIIYISRDGQWLLVKDKAQFLRDAADFRVDTSLLAPLLLAPGHPTHPLINTQTNEALAIDCFFPVLHGSLAEDGTLQGLLEMLGTAFVGCDTLSAAVCMEKHVTKQLLRHAGIPTLDWISMHSSEQSEYTYADISQQLTPTFFMKTVKSGSSIGVYKVRNEQEYKKAIDEIFNFGSYIILEKNVDARELEVSVIGNDAPQATIPGEIIVHGDFYSYDAKYFNPNAAKVVTPADISITLAGALQKLAIKAFTALRCSGMARIDFLAVSDDEYYINEINPLPGFTNISMYAKNWLAAGVSYTNLLTSLIDLAKEKHQQTQQIHAQNAKFVTDKRKEHSDL